jgi:putative inorganic carbon (HCO3(-)) transporter
MTARAASGRPVPGLVWGTVALLAGVAGALVTFLAAIVPVPLALAVITAAAAVAVVLRPDWGLALLIFVTYLGIAEILVATYNFPSIVKFTAVALVAAVGLRWACSGVRPGGDMTAVAALGLVWLGAAASLLNMDSLEASQESLNRLARDIVFAVAVLTIVTRAETLRMLAWTLVLAGAVTAAVTVHQYFTESFDRDYFGLGKAELHQIVGEIASYRVGGHIGEPNYYAQTLLIVIPFAADRTLNEPRRWLRALAGVALLVCVLAVIVTFSRGAFVALVAMTLALVLRWASQPRALAIILLSAVLVWLAAPSDYWDRLRAVGPAPSSDMAVEDVSLEGRRAEMIVAWNMFLDHPLLGVGDGNYPAKFQSYVQKLHLPPRHENREAHSLYLEIAAERGLIGLLTFGALIVIAGHRIVRARRKLRSAGLDDPAHIATAIAISLFGFGVSAMFLHGAYARYLWIVIGLALSLERVAAAARETRNERGDVHAAAQA